MIGFGASSAASTIAVFIMGTPRSFGGLAQPREEARK